jgi:hypothetical protein
MQVGAEPPVPVDDAAFPPLLVPLEPPFPPAPPTPAPGPLECIVAPVVDVGPSANPPHEPGFVLQLFGQSVE